MGGQGDETTFYAWKKKYAGMGIAEFQGGKSLEEESRRLKQVVADLTLDKAMLPDVLEKGLKALSLAKTTSDPFGGDPFRRPVHATYSVRLVNVDFRPA